MNLTITDFDIGAVRSARLFWITGTGLSDEPLTEHPAGAARRA